MTTSAERPASASERERRIRAGLDRIRADWRPFLGLVIGAPNRRALVQWVRERYQLDAEVAEIALDQKLFLLVELPAAEA